MPEMIRTVNLSKAYNKVHVVYNLNLSIKQGEIFGFLGLNGAGKTTTIQMLLGMIKSTTGECYLQGKKVSLGNLDIWNDVGYIVETPYAYPELTVRENLEIVLKLRAIEDQKRMDWIIEQLKLKKYQSKKVKHLSLGNAQRLGIAKALIHKPKILILDEPTNGLDPAGVVEVRELLKDLAKKAGVTILISSHKLEEISKMATNIGIIHYGKLIKEIDVKQLENQLEKSLIIDGNNKAEMRKILSQAGYKVNFIEQSLSEDRICLQIQSEETINNPEKVVTILVNAGCPPSLLKVEKEDLEMYFLRVIKENEGN